MRELTEEHILSELRKLRYTYNINKVIRYNFEREEKFQTQSVAEHVANMIFLAMYFRELEDRERKMDFEKVVKIIMMHDLGEIETGDVISIIKNSGHYDIERKAIQEVKAQSPDFIKREIEEIFEEYENPKTVEGRFVKAIDKMEGQLFWMEKDGVEMVNHVLENEGLRIHIEQPKVYEKIFKC